MVATTTPAPSMAKSIIPVYTVNNDLRLAVNRKTFSLLSSSSLLQPFPITQPSLGVGKEVLTALTLPKPCRSLPRLRKVPRKGSLPSLSRVLPRAPRAFWWLPCLLRPFLHVPEAPTPTQAFPRAHLTSRKKRLSKGPSWRHST